MNRVRACLFVLLLATALPASADIAVVVNKDSGISQISRSDAINIFMGRYRKLPNGHLALPIDLTPLKSRFYRALVNKDLATVNSYWARLVFSGEASPPQQLKQEAEVRELISNNANMIGYIDSAHVTNDVHVVLILGE